MGRHFLDFLQTHVDEAAEQMEQAFGGLISPNPTEADISSVEGTVRTIKLIAGALPWDGNPVVQLLLQDITDLKRIQNALHRLTITDELTGAFNRRHAFSVAKDLYSKASTYGTPFSVAVMDIDHFKRVNDTYGHAAGDAALRTLSQTVQTTILTPEFGHATFARFGGEEFALLLPNKDEREAAALCDLVREAVANQPIVSPAGTFHTTISIGVAELGISDASFDMIFSNADQALYRAKAGGRNRVCVGHATVAPPQRGAA